MFFLQTFHDFRFIFFPDVKIKFVDYAFHPYADHLFWFELTLKIENISELRATNQLKASVKIFF